MNMDDFFDPFTVVLVGVPILLGLYLGSLGSVAGFFICWAVAGFAAYFLYKK